MATASNEIDEIRRQMAQIRRELHEDVQGVVAGAEAATDWRRYVRLYPWACVGAAFGLGFLVAPRRRRHAVDRIEHAVTLVPERVKEAVHEIAATQTPEVRKKEAKAGLVGMLFAALGPIAMRAARNYAMSFAENWIAQQAAAGNSPLAFLQGIPGLAGMPGMPGAPESPTPAPGVPPGYYGPTSRPKTPGL